MVGAPARAGFGAAVRTAVAEIPAARDPRVGSGQDWLWLLHDDSAPEPEALAELLLAVERAPSVTVAGTKQVAWDDRRELVDVGLSISRWAERLTLIDLDEHDQGQYDARSDVFAVNSAGMLVRRDVWDTLGGFDPALHGVGDDVDLCWRNRLAGHRVVVVPGAVVRHAGSRPHPFSTPHAVRAAEVYLRLKHAAPWNVPLLAVGAVLGGIARLLLGLLAKDPGHGTGQLLGSLAGVARPFPLWRSRRSAARSRRRPRSIVRPLVTSRREVWSHRKSVLDAFTSRGTSDPEGFPLAEEYVPSGNSDDDFAALAPPARPWAGTGVVVALVLLLTAALVGLHRFVGAAALAGGALIPVAGTPGGGLGQRDGLVDRPRYRIRRPRVAVRLRPVAALAPGVRLGEHGRRRHRVLRPAPGRAVRMDRRGRPHPVARAATVGRTVLGSGAGPAGSPRQRAPRRADRPRPAAPGPARDRPGGRMCPPGAPPAGRRHRSGHRRDA
ncbi:hypothetical protein MN0502_09690 [Arthrobacter sp. MN05-02]|nr:hypothetical protein MN0502_09690 [Arthrobacter sp. MN05-02]